MSEVAAAGAALGVAGSILGTQANVKAINQRADLEDYQADAKTAEAATIRQTGDAATAAYARQTSLAIGKARAQTAAGGVSTTSGTPLFNELDNIKQAAIGKFNIRRQYDLAAYSADIQSGLLRRQATYDRMTRSGAMLSGAMRGTSILTSWASGLKGGGGGNPQIPGATDGGYPLDTLDG